MLSFKDVAIRRGTTLLISGLSGVVYPGTKLGLVGANGCGKSSLFKVILRELDSDAGAVEYGDDLRVACMRQEVEATATSAIDYVMAGDEAWLAVSQALLTAEAEEDYDAYGPLHERMDAIDGYTAQARAGQLLTGLGFTVPEFDNPVSSFSGGWRIRLNLARALMAPSDLLLLDEPTNHLDLETVLWLANWLKQYPGTLLLISHDREFLDEIVDTIAFVEHGSVRFYKGNYSSFEIQRAEQLAVQQANFEKQQRQIAHLEDFVRRFRAKATKARQAQSRVKALERMSRIAPAHVDSPFEFEIPAAEKVSSPLVLLRDADLGYDSTTVLSGVSFSLEPGDRIGLLGVNGAGKSTFVKSLVGELPLLAGERVEGHHLEIGYFSQHQVDDLDLHRTALAHLADLDGSVREQELRNYLGGFDFHGDKVKAPVSTFSGGEKARLTLALITWCKPNVLLLDEPTNHLDIDMRQALTMALQAFEGAMVVISHDRHLLANTVDAWFLVADGRVAAYTGDLDTYSERTVAGADAPALSKATTVATAAPQKQRKQVGGKEVRQLRTRIATIDKRLTRLQEKLATINATLGDTALYEADDSDRLHELLRDQHSLTESIEELEAEWLEKQERLESSGG